jgi:hypothetical protein
MNFNLHKPCANCPFRSDITFYLPEARRREIADHLQADGTFQCHKTTDGDWDDDFNYVPTGNESHCAGALLVMLKSGAFDANWRLRFAVGFGLLDPNKLDQSVPVFDTLALFVTSDSSGCNSVSESVDDE